MTFKDFRSVCNLQMAVVFRLLAQSRLRSMQAVRPGTEATMAYDKDQAAHEFTKWSESYDRCILQWLLFGPSHQAIIKRIRQRLGERPLRVLDVGCGTGVFAARIREALPQARVWGVDLVAGMLAGGAARWR